jgi:CBS domain-containing protein
MINVQQLLQSKDPGVVSTTPRASVYEALVLMKEKDIGALPVLENGRLVGLLSERDYARGVVLRGRTSRETTVGELMSKPVFTVKLEDSIQHCMSLMTERRVRHLPVVEGGQLVGIVTIGDVVKQIITDQEHLIHELEGYIRGT